MGLFGKKDTKEDVAYMFFREAQRLSDPKKLPMELNKAMRFLKKAVELEPREEKYKKMLEEVSRIQGKMEQNTPKSVDLGITKAEEKVSYLKGRVQFTEKGIGYKPYSEVVEVPYPSIKGLCFRSSGPHFDYVKGPQFDCLVMYEDEQKEIIETKLVSTDEALSAYEWDVFSAYTHGIYGEVIKTCERLGHRIMEYPCPNILELSDLLKKLGIECHFITPDYDDYKLFSSMEHPDWFSLLVFDKGGSKEYREWLMDIGGYSLENSSIEQIRLQEVGRSEYHTGDLGGGSGWHTQQAFVFDCTVKVSSIPEVDYLGLLGDRIDYIWDGRGLHVIKEDAELNKALKKAKAPSIEVKNNHIRYIYEKMPSEKLFRCIERIAEHVCNEAS